MLTTRDPRRDEYKGSLVAVVRQPAPVRTRRPDDRRYRPIPLWRRAAGTLTEAGPRALLWGALAELGVRRVTVYRVGIKEALARGEPVPGVTLGLLSHRQVSAYVALRPDTPESEVRRRLQDGAECVAAWRDGLLVATRWLRTGKAEIAYLGAAMSVSPGVWYAFDAFTLPEERRRGISGMVTAALVKRAQNLGATAVINAVVPENREGRGLARRSEPLGVLRSLRLGRWRIVASRLPPGYLGTPGPLGSTAQTT